MTLGPVIIEVCLNGETPVSLHPHVPRSPDQIVRDGLQCLDAGAAILHSHTDDSVLPSPSSSGKHDSRSLAEAWTKILEQRPDTIFYPTMSGGGYATTIEQRSAHMQELIDQGLLRLALIDMGTSNLSFVEDGGLPSSADMLFVNTNSDAHYMFDFCRRNRVGATIGCIEPGFIRVVKAFSSAGRVPPGSELRLTFGGPRTLMGLPPDQQALDLYISMIEETKLPWNVGVFGGDVMANGFARYALERGGHLRVGLEDYRSNDTPTNAELVTRAVALAREVGRPIASSEDAARILGLPTTTGKVR
jgi:3-keto-5-aminohexanoate cleavage enzyme